MQRYYEDNGISKVPVLYGEWHALARTSGDDLPDPCIFCILQVAAGLRHSHS